MRKTEYVVMSLLLLFLDVTIVISAGNTTLVGSDGETTKLLSRKRRFLIFPDGSSFQLVFCTQNQGYIQIGDIVWFGNTAALAWELPTDPNIFYDLLRAEKTKLFEGNRRYDTKHIVYFDERGKVLSIVPYRRKFIVNPAFAKRSVDSVEESNSIIKLSKEKLHELHMDRRLLDDLDESSASFHREGRKSLYAKLEIFLEGLGWRGKECVLRLLCENSRAKKKQGTFLQEITKATFTYPQRGILDESDKEYDAAFTAMGNCAELYPECEDRGVLFQDD